MKKQMPASCFPHVLSMGRFLLPKQWLDYTTAGRNLSIMETLRNNKNWPVPPEKANFCEKSEVFVACTQMVISS